MAEREKENECVSFRDFHSEFIEYIYSSFDFELSIQVFIGAVITPKPTRWIIQLTQITHR